MRHRKNSNTYVARNCSFNATEITAYSYGWWQFVAQINGFVVFNEFRYSPTTSRHQIKVRQLMRELDINIDLYVSIGCDLRGRRRGQIGDAAVESVENAFVAYIQTEGEMKWGTYATYLKTENVFQHELSENRKAELITQTEEALCDAFLCRSLQREKRIIAKTERTARETQRVQLSLVSAEATAVCHG